MEHSNYIKSKKWKSLRQEIFKRDNYICQDCKILEATEVHHLHYKNYLNEAKDDLISLCRVCHGKRHGIEKYHLPVKGQDFGEFGSYSEMVQYEMDRILEKDD